MAAISDSSGNYEQAQLLIAQSHIKEGNPSAAIDIYNSIMDILSSDNRSLAESNWLTCCELKNGLLKRPDNGIRMSSLTIRPVNMRTMRNTWLDFATIRRLQTILLSWITQLLPLRR